MKLLLISVKSEKAHGGIAVWTERFISACNERGIDCDVVNTEAVGERLKTGNASRSLKDELVRTKRILKDLKKSLEKSDEYAAVHLNTSCGPFGLVRDYLMARKIKKKKLRLVVHFHCDIPYWIRKSFSFKYLGKLVKLSDERLVLCENSRAYLEKNFGVQSVMMPNFIDSSMLAAEEKQVGDQLTCVLFVGGVMKSKGAEEIYTLARKFPNMTFELIGAVSAAVAEWDKPENVILSGGMPHDKVIEKLDTADIFLFPSHSEGFSLALTEAMSRGLPCIATDVGANADMLEGGCGIVVNKGDVDAMEKAINALTSADLRREFSRSAKEKVKNTYTTEAVMQKLCAVYTKE